MPVTIQLPSVVRAEAEGCREVEPGVTSLLARLPAAKGTEGPVSILVRAVPTSAEGAGVQESSAGEMALPGADPAAPSAGGAPAEDGGHGVLDLAGRTSGDVGRLRLGAVVLSRNLPVGSVLDEAATASVLRDEGVVPLREVDLVTVLAPGVRLAHLLDESYAADYEIRDEGAAATGTAVVGTATTGLEATVQEDGRLRLSWSTSPRWGVHEADLAIGRVRVDLPEIAIHSVTRPPAPGRRLVALCRVKGGGTAAVLVEFAPLRAPAD
jgi:hypothetical protein